MHSGAVSTLRVQFFFLFTYIYISINNCSKKFNFFIENPRDLQLNANSIFFLGFFLLFIEFQQFYLKCNLAK